MLVFAVLSLLVTLNSYRPPRWEITQVTAFANGWLASELPFHRLVFEGLVVAVMAKLGWIDGTPAYVGLALLTLSWIGVVGNIVQAFRAAGVLEEALREGLGDDYRSHMAPELTEDEGAPVKWRRLLVPFLMSDPRVEAIKDIAYVPDAKRYHRLDIYRPKHPLGGGGRPVMLFLHGGAWVIGD